METFHSDPAASLYRIIKRDLFDTNDSNSSRERPYSPLLQAMLGNPREYVPRARALYLKLRDQIKYETTVGWPR